MKITKSQLLKIIKEAIVETMPEGIRRSASAQIAQEIEIALQQAQMSKSYKLTGPGHQWFKNIADLAAMGMEETETAPRSTKLNEDTLDDALHAFGQALAVGTAATVYSAMTLVELLATSEGRQKLQDILDHLPKISQAICQHDKAPRALCAATESLTFIFKKMSQLISIIDRVPGFINTVAHLIANSEFPEEKVALEVSEIKFSRKNINSLLEAGMKKSDFFELQKDYKIIVESSDKLEESAAVMAVVAPAVISMFMSQSGRSTLSKLLRILPNFVKKLCEIPEKSMGSSDLKPIAFVAKYATKSCNDMQDFGPLILLADTLDDLEDEDAENIVNSINSTQGTRR